MDKDQMCNLKPGCGCCSCEPVSSVYTPPTSVQAQLFKLMEIIKQLRLDVDGLLNIDFPQLVEEKINEMVADGSFQAILENIFNDLKQQIENLSVEIKNNIYNAVLWGADNTGTQCASGVINTLLGQFGYCYLPNGTYLICATINISGGDVLIGQSKTGTRLWANNLLSVIESDSWETLQDTNSNAGESGFTLERFLVDGRGVANYGISIYGYAYHVTDVKIQSCKVDGFRSQWGTTTGFAADGNVMEAYISGLHVHGCDNRSVNFMGPHDSFLRNLIIENCAYGLFLADNDNGQNIASGTVVTDSHIYSCTYDGVWVNSACILNNVTSESNLRHGFTISKQCWLYACHSFNNVEHGYLVGPNVYNSVIKGDANDNKGYQIVFSEGVADNLTVDLTSFVRTGQGQVSGAENLLYNSDVVIRGGNQSFIHHQAWGPTVQTPPDVGGGIKNPYNCPMLVFMQGATDVYVNINDVSINYGNQDVVYVPMGASFAYATKPTLLVYLPILS